MRQERLGTRNRKRIITNRNHMKLYIKTTTYQDGHCEYELMKKHEIRLFGKTILKWYTKFQEPMSSKGSWDETILEYKHNIYKTYESVLDAKTVYETGPIEYRGYEIKPLGNMSMDYTYTPYPYNKEREYYTSTRPYTIYKRRYSYHSTEIVGPRGVMARCKKEIDEIVEASEKQKARTTKVKSTIE